MTTTNPDGIASAVVLLLKAASWTRTPVLAMVGDLSHYAENQMLSSELPAVFVQAIDFGWGNDLDLSGEDIAQTMTVRVLLVDSWDTTKANVEVVRMQAAKELMQAFIRSPGEDYRLDDAAAGVTIEMATCGKLEFRPPEHSVVSQAAPVENRRLFAIAMPIQILARATR